MFQVPYLYFACCFILMSQEDIKICNSAALENASMLLTCKLLPSKNIFGPLSNYLTPMLNCINYLSTTCLIYSSHLGMCLLFLLHKDIFLYFVSVINRYSHFGRVDYHRRDPSLYFSVFFFFKYDLYN